LPRDRPRRGSLPSELLARLSAEPGRRALDAALDPEADPIKAGNLALKLIETADPPSQSTLELSANLTPEQVERLSLREAIAYAERLGIEVPAELPPAATQA
jgi:hypothetical protein